MTAAPPTRAWQVHALLASARAAAPFCADSGQVFATIPLGPERHQLVPLQSTAFRNWLLARFYQDHPLIPRPSAVNEVIRFLEATAQYGEGTHAPLTRKISLRVASSPGREAGNVLLDLHNGQGEAVEITSRGWRVTNNVGGDFCAAESAAALPHPTPRSDHRRAGETSSAFHQFEKLLGLTPQHFTHCLSWLMAALSRQALTPSCTCKARPLLPSPPSPGCFARSLTLGSRRSALCPLPGAIYKRSPPTIGSSRSITSSCCRPPSCERW